MDLSKKTTILFSPQEHERLTAYAARRGVSLGELVREACTIQYGAVDADKQIAAVATLRTLALPVASPRTMKRESVPSVDEIIP